MLEGKKLALVHVAKNELGLDDDTYRAALQNICGVGSSRELTAAGFAKLMNHFRACGFKDRRGSTNASPIGRKSAYQKHLEKWQALGHRPGMASAKQLAMIDAVWDQLAWYWNKDGQGDRDKALHGFIKSRFDKVERLRFLSASEAYKIVEALKAIQQRKRETP